ncbi:MAG TPA: ABC transporter ATP-binding protein [Thermoplasmata archaeon]|nr:ABC transporter ATP-binding protein [Thermoplasmata archaeon]
MTASLEAVDLTKTYGFGNPVPALDGASFKYEGHGAVGYLGPNGAGKTTTLKLFVGLLRPTRGRAFVNGADVLVDRKIALWDVGSVIETPEPYPSQRVREALEMIGEFRGIPPADLRSDIDRYHRELDLPALDQKVGKLSKGQRQRVVIAAALLGDPSVLLLDEPTSGLDPAERILIRNLLNELKRDRLVLMSSHLMQEVTEICDRVIFVNRGRIVFNDTVEAVNERFRTKLLEVEFAQPLAPDRLAALQASVGSVTPLSDRRFHIAFDGSDSRRAALLAACQQVGAVVSFSSASLVLEEAYLQLMQPTAQPAPPR